MAEVKAPVIATVMKLEAPYIVEWVAWHKLQGFDLLIADNCAEGTQTELLRRLGAAGYISYLDARHLKKPPQLRAFNRLFWCAYLLGYRLLGFMDVDEFFEPLTGDRFGGAALIQNILAKPDIWAVSFRWSLFGSSGIEDSAPGLVLERFMRRGPSAAISNRAVKSFHRMNRLIASRWYVPHRLITNPHYPRIPKDHFSMDGTIGLRMDTERSSSDWKLARVRHYAVKSAEEFRIKRSRGRAFFRVLRDEREYWDDFDLNDVADPLAQEMLVAVKQKIDEIERAIATA